MFLLPFFPPDKRLSEPKNCVNARRLTHLAHKQRRDVHVDRARTRSTLDVLRHPQRLTDTVYALEAHADCDLRVVVADEDEFVQVVESAGGPVENRERVRIVVGVTASFANQIWIPPNLVLIKIAGELENGVRIT
jgi:hypothetical protein